jgi:hypothetical protein
VAGHGELACFTVMKQAALALLERTAAADDVTPACSTSMLGCFPLGRPVPGRSETKKTGHALYKASTTTCLEPFFFKLRHRAAVTRARGRPSLVAFTIG